MSRARTMMKVVAPAIVAAIAAATQPSCSSSNDNSGSSSSALGGCDTEYTCTFPQVCRYGSCIDCTILADTCDDDSVCCNDGICVDYGEPYGRRCGQQCTSNEQCNPPCCAGIEGTDQGVCAPSVFCGLAIRPGAVPGSTIGRRGT